MSFLLFTTVLCIFGAVFTAFLAKEEDGIWLIGTAAFSTVAAILSFFASSYYYAGQLSTVDEKTVYVDSNYNILGTGKIDDKNWWITVEKDSYTYCWIVDKQPPINGQIITKSKLTDGKTKIELVPYSIPPANPPSQTAEAKPNPQ